MPEESDLYAALIRDLGHVIVVYAKYATDDQMQHQQPVKLLTADKEDKLLGMRQSMKGLGYTDWTPAYGVPHPNEVIKAAFKMLPADKHTAFLVEIKGMVSGFQNAHEHGVQLKDRGSMVVNAVIGEIIYKGISEESRLPAEANGFQVTHEELVKLRQLMREHPTIFN